MTIRKGNNSLSFDYTAAACLCLCAVMLGRQFPAALLCMILHEAGHAAVIVHSGGRVSVTLKCMCADMTDVDGVCAGYRRQAVCAAAGPLVNLVCIPIFYAAAKAGMGEFFTQCAVISASLFVFNILPVLSTDGGALAEILLRGFLSDKAVARVMYTLTALILAPVCAAAFLVLLRTKSNFTMLIALISLFISGVIGNDK